MAQHLGAYPIDADALSHQAMQPGAPAYKPVVETFGQLILDSDKRINRQMLGTIVFSNPAALKKLEEITHPVIRQAIAALVTRAKQPVIIIEAIKLLEGELADAVDEVWVVNAKPETQYRRLLEKRKMSPDEAKQRMLSQPPQSDKLKRANVVIQNDGNVEETWKQVQAAWAGISRKLQPPADAQSATTIPVRPAPAAANPAPAPAAPAAPPAPAATPQIRAVLPSDDDDGESRELSIDTAGVNIKRGMPGNAELIANFISQHSGQGVSRMDVMMAFGQKSYLLAQDNAGAILGMLGWQVENLITRVDEFYTGAGAQQAAVVYALVRAMEAASKELQSEVSFIFLPPNAAPAAIKVFMDYGYEPTTVKEIKIPAWREALQEAAADNSIGQILHKRLRKDRVLTPI
jgi:dephospho-CoA kinase